MDLGEAYRQQDRPEQAEVLYLQAIEVMEESKHIRGLAMAFNNIGLACTQQEKWDLAEDYLCRSIAFWQQLGEPFWQANSEDNLADAYLKQQRWQEAMQALDSAQAHLEGLEITRPVQELLGDIEEHRQTAIAGLGAGSET